MKLSTTMASHLKWCIEMTALGVEMLGPTHHQNRITHQALVRRGMLREVPTKINGCPYKRTEVTPKGKTYC